MFGNTNPFGQSTTSPFGQASSNPFGSQPVFGQTSNASNNPFAPKPFGSPTANPFGAQTGGSIFGGTSTGVFGQTPSPLATTHTFGASSSPAFGASTPAFGATSTPAFGGSSTPAFGSSLFGQKPSFGGFGSTTAQSNPFGGTSTFGSSPFGSTSPFGSSNTPAFGATSTPAFGSTSTPAFGATSTPAFGSTSTPAFGASSTPAFGASSTPMFGASSTPAFGATSTPAFGATSTPAFGSTTFGSTGTAFGVSSAPAFGSSTTAFGGGSSPLFGSSSTFGASSTPAFGSNTTSFGASSTPSFSFGSTPAFGQSTAAFGSTAFGTSSFGAQSAPFGAQSTTPSFGSPGFGQPTFGTQQTGSRVVPYSATPETDGTTTGSQSQTTGKLESISAMPVYKEKSHEELRWEDYQRGDKGGPSSAQPASGIGFSASTQASPFGSTGTFGQTPASTFSSTSGSLFGQKPGVFGSSGFSAASTPTFSSPFGASSSSPFGASSTAPSLFGSAPTPAFGAGSTPSLFSQPASSAFGSTTPFGSSLAAGSTSAFGSGLTFGNTQSAGLFQSSPATAQAPSLFGQSTAAFGQTTPAFGSSLFGTQSAGFGGSLFSSSTSSLVPSSAPMGFGQTTPSLATPFQSATPAQTSGGFSFGNFGQTPAASSGFGGVSSVFGQSTFGQMGLSQPNVVVQPAPVTNPFGTLPAMPQMSIGRAGSSSIQYGISSMPVSEKPTPVRVSPLLTPRHLSQRRIKLPPRKYYPKSDGPMVPFFCDEEEAPSTPKADAVFIPRENPRALIIRPIEQWPSKSASERQVSLNNVSSPAHENGGKAVENNEHTHDANGHAEPSKSSSRINGNHDNETGNGMDSSYTPFSGNRAGEAAIVYEHGADIEALMPKLRHPEYFTEPRIQELAAKERAESGFCCRVKDFVIGRHGYGSIKFEGETDVRRLDLESLVQFNNKEVIVYKDESKKPPVGQGLNKPAEVTLLNVKCVDKKTGRQFTEGAKVDSYRELLRRKAVEQGAEFVSYDPIKGEWKFKVKHFSTYEFGGIDEHDDTVAKHVEGELQSGLGRVAIL